MILYYSNDFLHRTSPPTGHIDIEIQGHPTFNAYKAAAVDLGWTEALFEARMVGNTAVLKASNTTLTSAAAAKLANDLAAEVCGSNTAKVWYIGVEESVQELFGCTWEEIPNNNVTVLKKIAAFPPPSPAAVAAAAAATAQAANAAGETFSAVKHNLLCIYLLYLTSVPLSPP